MLKLLHTADWHLGKDLYGYDRKDEFDNFFIELKKAIRDNGIDILIIAGDVFDTANPGNATAKTYYELINELHTEFQDLEIIITGGNHDSPSYLNAPKDVLESFRTHVIGCAPRNVDGSIDFDGMVLEISRNAETTAIICAVPFLRRGDRFVNDEPITIGDFYNNVVSRALEMRGDRNIPIIATGHLTTTSAQYTTMGGEQIGGQDSIDANIFSDDISYLALGHIHKPQPVDEKRFIRYSGSPIAFSFAEKDYKHSLTIIEFDGKEISDVKLHKLKQMVPLMTIPDEPKHLSDVKDILRALPNDEDMYLEVNMLQEDINPDSKAQIIELLSEKKAKFCTFKKNIIRQSNDVSTHQPLSAEEFKNTDPLEIIKEIYQNKLKSPMDDKYVTMLKPLLEEL